MSEWQPIASAPKDGTLVVLFGTLHHDPTQMPRACVSRYCRSRKSGLLSGLVFCSSGLCGRLQRNPLATDARSTEGRRVMEQAYTLGEILAVVIVIGLLSILVWTFFNAPF